MSTPINAAAEAARESHRSGDGKFGSQPHSNPGQLSGLTGPEFEGVYGAAPVVATKRASMMRGTSIEQGGHRYEFGKVVDSDDREQDGTLFCERVIEVTVDGEPTEAHAVWVRRDARKARTVGEDRTRLAGVQMRDADPEQVWAVEAALAARHALDMTSGGEAPERLLHEYADVDVAVLAQFDDVDPWDKAHAASNVVADKLGKQTADILASNTVRPSDLKALRAQHEEASQVVESLRPEDRQQVRLRSMRLQTTETMERYDAGEMHDAPAIDANVRLCEAQKVLDRLDEDGDDGPSINVFAAAIDRRGCR